MVNKITNIELAKIFGYEKVTFTRWKNSNKLELMSRLEWLKVAGIMIKNNITPYQVLSQQNEIETLKVKLDSIKNNLNSIKGKKDEKERV